MADLNAILDSIKELKLLEVAELVKMMEEEFGVSAAAPVMVAGGAAADGGAAAYPADPGQQADHRLWRGGSAGPAAGDRVSVPEPLYPLPGK